MSRYVFPVPVKRKPSSSDLCCIGIIVGWTRSVAKTHYGLRGRALDSAIVSTMADDALSRRLFGLDVSAPTEDDHGA